MNCDRCKNVIEETKGYAKTETRVLVNMCKRVGGILRVDKIADKISTERICVSCVLNLEKMENKQTV